MGQTAESTRYEIRFSQARHMRGLNAWGLFEVVDAGFNRGISDHKTEAEAKAALADLQGRDSK